MFKALQMKYMTTCLGTMRDNKWRGYSLPHRASAALVAFSCLCMRDWECCLLRIHDTMWPNGTLSNQNPRYFPTMGNHTLQDFFLLHCRKYKKIVMSCTEVHAWKDREAGEKWCKIVNRNIAKNCCGLDSTNGVIRIINEDLYFTLSCYLFSHWISLAMHATTMI